MIHRTTSAPTNGSNGGARTRGSNRGLPYLTAEKLTTEPTAAKILGARVESDKYRAGEMVPVMKLAYKGNSYLWTIRHKATLDVLCDGLGEDEEQWAGSEILLYVEVDDFDNKSWIRCEVPVNAPAKGKTKK